MKAKDVSLLAIVVAIVWVALLFAAKGMIPVFFAGKTFGLDAKEIIASGAFFVIALFIAIMNAIVIKTRQRKLVENTGCDGCCATCAQRCEKAEEEAK